MYSGLVGTDKNGVTGYVVSENGEVEDLPKQIENAKPYKNIPVHDDSG